MSGVFGVPVTGLTLVDPRYYHLDTALAVLADDVVMYLSCTTLGVFRRQPPTARRVLPERHRNPTKTPRRFGLNAVSDGRHVVLSEAAAGLIAQWRERGFEPIGANLSELHKADGNVKCCTLELRGSSELRGGTVTEPPRV